MINENHEGHSKIDLTNVVETRKSRRADTDSFNWTDSLKLFLEKQPNIVGEVIVSDISIPESGGGSSGTVIFKADYDEGNGKSQRKLVLRFYPKEGLFHTYDFPAQYSILKALQKTDVPVPKVIGLDAKGDLLGVTGFVMEYIDGEVPPPSYYTSGIFFESSVTDRKRMISDVISTLAKLHNLDWRSKGLEFLLRRGNGDTAIERDLSWYWSAIHWGVPEAEKKLYPIYHWLVENQPSHTDLSLNHGDTMLGNYMFRNNRLVAVLDWEMAFLGNPAQDIAYQAFANAVMGLGRKPLDGLPVEQDWKAEYEQISGRELLNWDYYYTIAVFKIHINMLLVFRNAPPEIETARDLILQFTGNTLMERWANNSVKDCQ